MNKEELILRVSEQTGVNKTDTGVVVESVIGNIIWELSDGHKVSINGFGTFAPKKKAARVGRNPHTGETVPIPERVLPEFKACDALKKIVSERNK